MKKNMRLIKTICFGSLLASVFSFVLVNQNVSVKEVRADETDVYDLKTGFAEEVGSQHDINAWGTPWGVESINIAELFKDGQGIKLQDSNCKLPEYDGSATSEWSASTLSLHTYPMFNNSSMTELGGYFNQYPDGWKMTANDHPELVPAWPSETGYCSANNKYLKYFHVAGAFHPSKGSGLVVYFTAPKTGNINISDTAYINNASSDGTYFFIYKIPAASFTSHMWSNNIHHGLFGGSPIYPNKGVSPTDDWSTWSHIPNMGSKEYKTDDLPVEKGDVIAWVYGGGNSVDYDLTYTSPKVTYVDNYDSIVLSDTSLKMCKGESKAISATVSPKESASKKINWTSTDENIASVNENGVITGHSDGTVTIKATLEGGTPKSGESEVSATCVVEISGNESIRITNNPVSLTVMQGETLSLTYETYPATNKIDWTIESGDEYASVDEAGVVSGLEAGSAVVRATVSGTTTYDEVTVQVTKASSPTLTLSQTGTIELPPGETTQITTSITPTYHKDDKVIVTVEDSSIATATWENKVITITGMTQGTTKLYASVSGGGDPIVLTIYVNKKAVKTYEWQKEFTNPMPTRWEQAIISNGVYDTELTAQYGAWGYSYETKKGIQGIAFVKSDIQYFSIFGGQGVHPLVNHQASVAFVANNEGTLDYSSHFVTQNAGSAQQFKILLNDEKIYPTDSEWQVVDASHPYEIHIADITVKQGDKIYTIVDSGTDDASDFCFINPTIKYTEMVESPCVVSIDKTEITLNVGEYSLIQATISDDDHRGKKLTWKSSNEGVATVNDAGEVTAVHSGTATVSVTIEDGNTVSCIVHVNMTTGEIVGIAVGSACGGLAVIAIVVVVIVVHNKKKKTQLEK